MRKVLFCSVSGSSHPERKSRIHVMLAPSKQKGMLTLWFCFFLLLFCQPPKTEDGAILVQASLYPQFILWQLLRCIERCASISYLISTCNQVDDEDDCFKSLLDISVWITSKSTIPWLCSSPFFLMFIHSGLLVYLLMWLLVLRSYWNDWSHFRSLLFFSSVCYQFLKNLLLLIMYLPQTYLFPIWWSYSVSNCQITFVF